MAPKDPRFARLSTDPRFIRPSKASQKVVLDERFKSLLSNDANDTEVGAKVDKYGRLVSKNSRKQEFKQFYRLEEGKSKGLDRARGEGLIESSDEEYNSQDNDQSSSLDSDEQSGDEEVILGSKSAKAVDKRSRRASSELSIDLTEVVSVPSTSFNKATQVESVIPTIENGTSRIAIVNLDWDHVQAIDLFKIFDSVLSPSASGLLDGRTAVGSRKSKTKIGKGRVESVKIFPSQFGKARLAKEEMEGPPVEIFSNRKNISITNRSRTRLKRRRKPEDEQDEDEISSEENGGEDFDEQALRRYQLERLRYYYAVVEFDTVSASCHAYDEVDGTEFEATANVFDLRYVPDDTIFDDTPIDVATAETVQLQVYKPVEFVTDALRNSKVKLTWDADDPQRAKITKATHMKKENHEEIDYSALLASDSEDEQVKRSSMRLAFGLDDATGGIGNTDDEDGKDEMEITFTPALSGDPGMNDGKDSEKEETSLEAYQRKDRERRQAKKERRKADKQKLAGGKSRRNPNDDENSDPDEAYDANAFGEAAGDNEDGQDGFFEFDSNGRDVGDVEVGSKKTSSQLSKQAAKHLEKEKKTKAIEALSLLVGDDENNSDEGKHFDMHAIQRAEKIVSKPKKVLKKGKDRRKYKEGMELLEKEKDRFEVDLKDDRFKFLHEDHEFALDPSNPRYMKTKNMERLLEENRRRRKDNEAGTNKSSSNTNPHTELSAASQTSNDLSSLVASIKRKNKTQQSSQGRGKRQKET